MGSKEKRRVKVFVGLPEDIEEQYNHWTDTELPDNAIITTQFPEPKEIQEHITKDTVLWVFYEIGAEDTRTLREGYLR